jgi:hypothetical protein
MKTLNNSQKLNKMIEYNDLVKKLYETKYNQAQWDNKDTNAVKWFHECRKIAGKKIFSL